MSDPDLEIASILAAVAARVPEARNQLLAATQLRVHRLASRMLHGGFSRVDDFEQTDDVLQTLLMRLLTSWDRILTAEDGSPLIDSGQFLCRVTRLLREVLIDLSRKHRGRSGNRPPQVPLSPGEDTWVADEGHDQGTDTFDPAQLALLTEFHAAVDILPEHLRQVVELHWYQEMTHEQVSRALRIAEPTSRKYWREARERLANKLGSDPFH